MRMRYKINTSSWTSLIRSTCKKVLISSTETHVYIWIFLSSDPSIYIRFTAPGLHAYTVLFWNPEVLLSHSHLRPMALVFWYDERSTPLLQEGSSRLGALLSLQPFTDEQRNQLNAQSLLEKSKALFSYISIQHQKSFVLQRPVWANVHGDLKDY